MLAYVNYSQYTTTDSRLFFEKQPVTFVTGIYSHLGELGHVWHKVSFAKRHTLIALWLGLNLTIRAIKVHYVI